MVHVVLVYNNKSGSGLQLPELQSLFDKAGFIIDDVIKIDRRIRFNLKKHVAKGATIAAVGGDGTISAVAGIVAETAATLLPLPGGTLNHFTKDLGIDQDLEDALKKARHGKKRQIDIGMVNDIAFVNNSSIGLYPSSLRDRNRFEDRLGKWLAAIVASVHSFIRFRVYDVTINGKSLTTPFIFIGNNKYDMQPGVISRQHLDEGLLSVYVVRATSRLDILSILPFVLVGRAERHEKLDKFTATNLVIRTKQKRIRVSRDGELTLLDSPLRYSIKHKILKVIF